MLVTKDMLSADEARQMLEHILEKGQARRKERGTGSLKMEGRMVKIFKTTVLGVGPWCVEFDDGEIITCRTEERAKLIADHEAALKAKDEAYTQLLDQAIWAYLQLGYRLPTQLDTEDSKVFDQIREFMNRPEVQARCKER